MKKFARFSLSRLVWGLLLLSFLVDLNAVRAQSAAGLVYSRALESGEEGGRLEAAAFNPFYANENQLMTGSDLTSNTGDAPSPQMGLRQMPDHRKSFFQSLSVDEFLETPGGGADACGLVHAGASVMFAAPCPGGYGSFLFSPTFDFDYFYELPRGLVMADSLYRAGLNLTWLNDVNDFWRVMLFVTPSYASDFETHSSKAIRVPGGGMAVWTPSPNWQFTFGALYTALESWSVLPIGGVIWQPNDVWRVEMTFPKPRICRRIETSAEWVGPLWLYLAGEFSGGTWAVDLSGRDDLATYRELRVMLGVERAKPKLGELNVRCELGVSFCRKLYFEDAPAEYRPDAGLVQKLSIHF